MSDNAKPSSPPTGNSEAPTNPTGEREAAEARLAREQQKPTDSKDAPVVWPRDMSAPETETPEWGRDPDRGDRG
jgi:hypothetical protein